MDIDILEPALNDTNTDRTNVNLDIHEENMNLNELLDSEPENFGGQLPSVLRVEFSTSAKTLRAKKRSALDPIAGEAPAKKKRITDNNSTSQRRKDRAPRVKEKQASCAEVAAGYHPGYKPRIRRSSITTPDSRGS
ncbi:hypothetical protein AAF712_014921 [Marasmius tenuissimus]|uniref:Uncharacterized protein n=1 Tax=Marasmius tenuissimus TaxID=585030 RepID=A0ABR2Z9Q1_9AGAR